MSAGLTALDSMFSVRVTPWHGLGVVLDRPREAFAFVDQFLGSAIHFETAGSLHGGRRVWVLATLPHDVEVSGDAVRPYVLDAPALGRRRQ